MSWRAVQAGVIVSMLLAAGCSAPPERFANLPQGRLPQVPPVIPSATLEARPVESPAPPPRLAVDVPGTREVFTEPSPGQLTTPSLELEPEPLPSPLPSRADEAANPRTARVPSSLTEWVDFNVWLQQLGWSALHPVPSGKDQRHETDGPPGKLSMLVGQRKAWWNGMQVWTGFPPRMERGRLKVHRRDVESHFGPLMKGQPSVTVPDRSIVIDAGHGGRNAGTRSIAGNRFEKEFTLDWAIRLRAILERRGWKVTMTRTNDVDLALAERVTVADASGAALFLSLHFNSAFPNREAAGLETYSVTPQGMASHVVREFADEPGKAYPNNAHDDANLRLAVAVHRSLLATTGLQDRGVRRARFMDVLRWQNRPSILVEGGYLSNPAEAARIQQPEFRQKLAEAVAAALP